MKNIYVYFSVYLSSSQNAKETLSAIFLEKKELRLLSVLENLWQVLQTQKCSKTLESSNRGGTEL